MPELPEVESVRRCLDRRLADRTILSADARRADVARARTTLGTRPATPEDLLAGARVNTVLRLGKQIAVVADDGRAVCVQLGMTGGLLFRESPDAVSALDHAHVVWALAPEPRQRGRGSFMVFRDPRRFGGLTCYPSLAALRDDRWSTLGPDALTIGPSPLRRALGATARAVKAALLDQAVLAGVGNIYADEALFRSGIAPSRRADRLRREEVERLAASIRAVLAQAVEAGGSTVRDYRDSDGQRGTFQARHHVYGRAGKPCHACGSTLRKLTIAQRTTVMCPRCQNRRAAPATPPPATYPHDSCAVF